MRIRLRLLRLEFRLIVLALLTYIAHKVTDGDILLCIASMMFFTLWGLTILIDLCSSDDD